MMRVVIGLAAAGALAMTAALVYGFTAGDGWDEVGVLLDFPWFVVSIVDVYVGFALFGVWVFYRDPWYQALPWMLVVMTLGNGFACLYALLAAVRASGDWSRFWLGRFAHRE